MTWFIILGFMLILIISGFHAHSIHIIFKIGSDTKAVPSWSFVNKINFQTLKALIKGLNKDKLKILTIGELVIPLSFFNRLFSKTLIFLFLFFYSQYLN
ncbi:hypothetical protein BK749_13835 [Bacillus thuringiensis serovar vazensis]|uniref:Uncharacterized protein n=2 Tax=Bacillus thuringiensis TaxID=1428 RepID=A0A243CWG0_BACTU|nr:MULTISPECIES: hypothetical protein [Bacillus cereus group]EEM56741.1 hypothetical protein bthur0007_53750 [Bacillus thuringiensis serovar monterrey BGSC 4AJ1]EEM86137.1 hypothetical protein bthur0012_59320 [Bacillus thuringiensis serovar pulsiensis BGSC 4CC1]MEB9674064.1 hypothetical protein [Bacillus anthracis]OTW52651.1 hypothetical protein BK699_05745 [Bacillus thuringiensis serovar mexicanensis]OTX09957.1 hypothetical protein BK705_03620 [Bacillus thuringiensis serovar monterrey]